MCEDIIGRCIQDAVANGQDYNANVLEAFLKGLQGVEEQVLCELSMVRVEKGLCSSR